MINLITEFSVFSVFDVSIHHKSHEIYFILNLADARTLCMCAGLWGVTSKCRDRREHVPRGVAVVWSLHISHIPCYASLITLASSAAPWLLLCTDSCWPPLTTIFIFSRSQSSLSSIVSFIQYSLYVSVCVCVPQLRFWPKLSFRQDTKQHRGVGGICLPLMGMCYW